MMMSGLTMLLIFSCLYIIGISILYFSKVRVNNGENKIYKILLITNLMGLILQILCDYVSYKYNDVPLIFSNLVFRLYLMYFVFWINVMVLYLVEVSFVNKKTFSKLIEISCALEMILMAFLPYQLYRDVANKVYYTYGVAIDTTFIISGIICVVIGIILFKKRKVISSKKSIPIYSFLVCGIVASIIQKNSPNIVIITAMESFICFIMYFTIENPDVKMLNELYKNKELTEQNYEEKYNFLFEITQEARNPLVKINSICNEIHNEDNKDKIKVGTDLISSLVRQLDFSINNVLNISTLDIQKLKIVDSKYNLNTLCNDLVKKIQSSIKDGVELHSEIPSSSLTLYGDYMKIKQILYSLLNNAVKNTENGFIEFKVNIIEKYDICRLIFNISDSGKGMPIEQINEILSTTGELDKQELENLEKSEFNIKLCQKVVKIMGGNLMIKSEIGKGTEVLLTFDQRVYHDKENSILNQYENSINNYKKVLIVSQDDRLVKKLKRKCQESNISYTTLLYGGDAVDRIKAGKKYDYILILDEMKEMSGLKTYQEMCKVEGFKTSVIVMLKEDKEHIKEHYLEDGFSDYLLLSDFDKEIERIINKY